IGILNHATAQTQPEKTVKSTVQKATIFQQGALLTSNESIAVNAGMTNIVFENVSAQLQANSLQAAGKNDLIIMDVQYRLKYAEVVKTDVKPDDPRVIAWQGELQNIQDSLEELVFVRKNIQNRNATLQNERSIVTNNRMMRGDFQKDSLFLFTQSIDFLRKRLMNLDAENLKLEKETAQEARLRNKFNVRIMNLNTLIAGIGIPVNTNPTKPVSQVIVTVMAERAMMAEISLSYFVAGAGWTASYDLKASKETQTIDLKHRATVYQNTGLDWKDVLLTLSTGNPSQENVKPALSPQFVGYYVPTPGRDYAERNKMSMGYGVYGNQQVVQNSNAGMSVGEVTISKDAPKTLIGKVDDGDGVEDFTKVSQNMMRIEYEIKLKYTIESDNKPHNVVIQSKTMPAQYSYSVVPKLDLDVFLMARVTDWEDMNLIAGTARVYFDNSYIGESYINPHNTNDTLQLNLGRDKSIVVTRNKVKDKCKDKSFSDNHLLTRVYEINVRNSKSIPIRMVVEDQMPVTKEAEIKIEYLEDSGAKFNPETGKLLWDFNLKAKDNKRLVFSFEVKSPKTKPLAGI
ncbi:MAG: hypothetical protein RL329_1908, partial [Bacteroidota bacterium]